MAEEKTKSQKEIRHIVRIANKDLDGNKSVHRALQGLRGVGQRYSKIVALAFEKETGIGYDSVLGEMDEEMDKRLEDIVLNPEKHGIPAWALNRRNDLEAGENLHLVMGDLDFSKRRDVQRLSEIKSYRGLRHIWKLTVRGQRTRSTHRGKGGVVGVLKKDAKAAKAAGRGKGKK